METNTQREVLTIAESAILLRCSKAHISNVINGKVDGVPPLPCVKVGRRKLIRRESITRWLEAVESLAHR